MPLDALFGCECIRNTLYLKKWGDTCKMIPPLNILHLDLREFCICAVFEFNSFPGSNEMDRNGRREPLL